MRRRFNLIEQNGERFIAEDYPRNDFVVDEVTGEAKVITSYNPNSVEFNPTGPLELYTWSDNKQIGISEARKQAAAAQLIQQQIEELKSELAAMDYKTSKYADGEYTDEQWARIVAERKAIREKIRALEKQI